MPDVSQSIENLSSGEVKKKHKKHKKDKKSKKQKQSSSPANSTDKIVAETPVFELPDSFSSNSMSLFNNVQSNSMKEHQPIANSTNTGKNIKKTTQLITI